MLLFIAEGTRVAKFSSDFEIDVSQFEKGMNWLDSVGTRAAQALFREATRIESDVIPRVPVATGYLKSTVSHEPNVPPVDLPATGRFQMDITVGDADTPYAKEVHETAGIPNRGYAWNPVDKKVYQKSGEGKFLERPVMEAAKGMEMRLKRDIEGLL